MALKDSDKLALQETVETWVEQGPNGLLKNYYTQFAKATEGMSAEERAAKWEEIKPELTEKLQKQVIAGAEQGGDMEAIRDAVAGRQSGEDQEVGMFRQIINSVAGMFGGMFELAANIITSIPVFGDWVKKFTSNDHQSPEEEARESRAAGAALGLAPITVGGNIVLKPTGEMQFVLAEALNSENAAPTVHAGTAASEQVHPLDELDSKADGKLALASLNTDNDKTLTLKEIDERFGQDQSLLDEFKKLAQAQGILKDDQTSIDLEANPNLTLPAVGGTTLASR